MIRRAWLCLAAAACLAGCDPIWSVTVNVRDPSKRPVEDAAVMFACRAPTGEAQPGWVSRTDKNGTARLGGLGSALPPGCNVAVARPGYTTHMTTFEAMCGATPLADCERVREEDVVLSPLGSAAPSAP